MSTELFIPIKELVERITGVSAFAANQNDIAPTGAYATILSVRSAMATSRGIIKKKVVNDGNDIVFTARYPVTWEVTTFGVERRLRTPRDCLTSFTFPQHPTSCLLRVSALLIART